MSQTSLFKAWEDLTRAVVNADWGAVVKLAPALQSRVVDSRAAESVYNVGWQSYRGVAPEAAQKALDAYNAHLARFRRRR